MPHRLHPKLCHNLARLPTRQTACCRPNEFREIEPDSLRGRRPVGAVAVELGVDVETNSRGEAHLSLEEDIDEDVWRTISPEVEAYIEATDAAFAACKLSLRSVGCVARSANRA